MEESAEGRLIDLQHGGKAALGQTLGLPDRTDGLGEPLIQRCRRIVVGMADVTAMGNPPVCNIGCCAFDAIIMRDMEKINEKRDVAEGKAAKRLSFRWNREEGLRILGKTPGSTGSSFLWEDGRASRT